MYDMLCKQPFLNKTMRNTLISLVFLFSLGGCNMGSVYQAYLGAPLPAIRVATVEGATFFRQDMINRYIDAVRFLTVDELRIENSAEHSAVQVEPGFHEYRVYFHWDMGNERGLAPALVNYAANRETMSRTLRFNARAGEVYTVHAQPYFSDNPRDITTLTHVDFWVEDANGVEVVSQAQGRYVPAQQ